MAEIVNFLVEALIAIALGLIGVNYEPEEVKEEASERLAAVVAVEPAPAIYTARASAWGYRTVSTECEAERMEVYEGLPVFIGERGYSS